MTCPVRVLLAILQSGSNHNKKASSCNIHTEPIVISAGKWSVAGKMSCSHVLLLLLPAILAQDENPVACLESGACYQVFSSTASLQLSFLTCSAQFRFQGACGRTSFYEPGTNMIMKRFTFHMIWCCRALLTQRPLEFSTRPFKESDTQSHQQEVGGTTRWQLVLNSSTGS